ncbi:MAG: VWA domain-containing protein [Planctomycetota bacterium]|nr:VWA domain-containing protein [Planctomycetota bacterium]
MSGVALFLHADWLPLLLLAPLLYGALELRERRRRRTLRQVIGRRAAELTQESARKRRAFRRVAVSLGVLLALLAALGPLVGEAEGQPEWRGVDLVVCLDVSRSMWARDLAPDRLGRAHQTIRTLAETAEGDRLALVAFAGEARLLVPLTRDRKTFTQLAEQADPTVVRKGGTDLGAALETALRALEGSASEHSAILLLTDGEDLEGRGARAAAACRQRGIAVHTIGYGTALGSKIVLADDGRETFLRDRRGREVISALDATSLRRVADAADGEYVDAAASTAPLASLYTDHIRPRAQRALATAGSGRPANRFQWPLGLALGLWLVALALSDRRRS